VVEETKPPRLAQGREHVVATLDEIPPGTHKLVPIGRHGVGVYNVNGTFHAIANYCPHEGGPLCSGRARGRTVVDEKVPGDAVMVRDLEFIYCPWHQWGFELATGTTAVRPEWSIRTYPVRVVGNDVLVMAGPTLKRGEKIFEVNGGNVVYEILGKEGDFIALTPGGRFSKDIPGLRPLAQALVKGGYRVLLWDRPNCGKSDVQFYGKSESHMRAETLHALITGLDIGPCIIAGGSGGARDSMLTTMLYPEIARKLVVWNIVGGVYGSFVLGGHYIVPSILATRGAGINGLLRVGEWRERIAENPRNEDRFRALDVDEFLKVMLRWLNAFVSKPGQTIPGVEDEMFDDITVPTLIIRGGENDWDHPKRTSLEVSCLIKGSTLIDPPWPEDAWERAGEKFAASGGKKFCMFDTWVQAAPEILKFLDKK
jgi:2-hydroxy-6-oxonona-2,4-dienedioate hydrolase